MGTQKVSISGSVDIEAPIRLGQKYVLVVEATCTAAGKADTATRGRIEVRALTLSEALVEIGGVESAYREKFADARAQREDTGQQTLDDAGAE